jgi:hypothetical protein
MAEENPVSAGEPPRQVRGRPFTKENAKKMALSAAAAKKRRKEARMSMLAALTDELDLGQELLKALKERDEMYLGMIMTATRLVGLQHDQSSEAMAQKMEIKSDAHVKKDSTVKLVIEDFTKPEES